jgi:hypothetical protein
VDSFLSRSELEESMKLSAIIFAAISFNLMCASVGENYRDLVGQGYRWLTVNGPYAWPTKEDLDRITSHPTDDIDITYIRTL